MCVRGTSIISLVYELCLHIDGLTRALLPGGVQLLVLSISPIYIHPRYSEISKIAVSLFNDTAITIMSIMIITTSVT